MSLQIDEVNSQVTVDPTAPAGPGAAKRALPTADELARFAQFARKVDCDASRTNARDQDD
jgi:hypothetical protein